MRRIKILPILIGTLLLGFVLVVGLLVPQTETDALTFKAGGGQKEQYFTTWYDDSTQCHYLFLPAYVALNSVTFESKGARMTIGGKVFKNGDDLSSLDTGTVYDITVNGWGQQSEGTFTIRQLADVATMFIDINPSTLKRINQSKKILGTASMTLLAPDGRMLYDGSQRLVKIKMRGNSTSLPPKKAYQIQLEHPDSLLGMAPATRWVLLANALDESNLKNKLVQDYAKTLDYGWTPDCKYVDVYINQAYNGIYLLSEKIEVNESRLHADTDSLHLFVIDCEGLIPYDSTNRQFFSSVSPNPNEIYLYEDELRRFLDAMRHPGADTIYPLEETIDIHSWSCKYLIDEVFSNQDMWHKSNYFYCYGQPPYVFYGGPTWDYDLSGRYPTNCFMGLRNSQLIPYYGLMDIDIFRAHTLDLYTTHCRPYAEWLIDKGIDSLAAIIQLSTRANSIRWRAMFNEDRIDVGWIQPTMPSPDSLKAFLQRHTAFLDKHWLHNIPYQKIYIDMKLKEGDFWIEYEPGATVRQYIQQVPNTEDYDSYVWQDSLSGKMYYPNTVIDDSNAYLVLCKEDDDADKQPNVPSERMPLYEKLSYGFLVIFAILGIILIGCNYADNKKYKNSRNKD